MSDRNKKKKISDVVEKLDRKTPTKTQFEPAEPQYTFAQIQSMLGLLSALDKSKIAKPLAVSAALGATLGGLHILWLIARYLLKF
jgi:hypothetical protein